MKRIVQVSRQSCLLRLHHFTAHCLRDKRRKQHKNEQLPALITSESKNDFAECGCVFLSNHKHFLGGEIKRCPSNVSKWARFDHLH